MMFENMEQEGCTTNIPPLHLERGKGGEAKREICRTPEQERYT
jgi:hypothetical protein